MKGLLALWGSLSDDTREGITHGAIIVVAPFAAIGLICGLCNFFSWLPWPEWTYVFVRGPSEVQP